MLKTLKNQKIWVILALIFILGTYLRVYHFNDWLHFELDQSRDAKVIDLAIQEGADNLPLLGPKAAGSFLRLGPIFYYFEYLSALVFGDTPSGMVAIACYFSCFTILVLFFLLRKYFEKNLSLLLTGLFSASLFFIMYSRFGWNPNNLPFFILLSFLALLNLSDPESKRKGIWLLVLSLALGITTQLHFTAFLAIPAVTALFLIWKRPRIRWTWWLGALLILLTLYSPVIINDIKTGGDNMKEFVRVFQKKTDSKKETHTFIEKAYKDITENSLGHFLILTGEESFELPRLKQIPGGLDFICDASCRKGIWGGGIGIAFFSLGAFLLLLKTFFALKNNRVSENQKNFLVLSSLWFIITLGLFFPIAYDIAPRFWLIISGLPLIFLGLTLETLQNFIPSKRLGFWLILVLASIFIFSNLWNVKKRFWQLENAPKVNFEIGPDRILKENTRVTLEQQYMIINHILGIYAKNEFPIYLNSEAYYRRSLLYHLDKKEIPRDDFRNASNSKKIYLEGNYFLIYPTSANWESKTEKYMNDFDVIDKKDFGTLTLWQLAPKDGVANAVRQEFEEKGKPKSAPGVPVRYRWEEIFDDQTGDEKEVE